MPRIPDSIKNPTQILGARSGTLHSLYAHARELLTLQTRVRSLVPGDVYVASLDAGTATLHLVTPSSALATRLRYNQRKLIAALYSDKQPVENLKVSVRPDPVPAQPQLREPKPLSEKNAEHLASTAQYIEDDALRKALMTLASRGTKP